jgi:DNA-nicking Smr family endonuclease
MSPRHPRDDRPLTDAEQQLWQSFTRNIDAAHSLPQSTSFEEYIDSGTIIETNASPDSKAFGRPILQTIDGHTKKHIDKGKKQFDYTLDLHGLNQQHAFEQLSDALVSSHQKGWRFLLVITGKGKGVLSAALPGWLANPELSRYITAFDQAQPKHGGKGAWYIMLKK